MDINNRLVQIPYYFAQGFVFCIPMKYYIIAGEASGDLHGSNLVKAVRQLDGAAAFRGWGGHLMQDEGVALVKHIRELAFMGFAEVVRNLPQIFSNIRLCKKDILAYAPDVVIFIDYPGFNLRMMQWAAKKGFKTAYYISPQVWAWKAGRVRQIMKYADKLMVIFPFEKKYFREKWNYEVQYTGHPLLPVIAQWKTANTDIKKDGKTIALLPGSRKQEISTLLPLMLATAAKFPDLNFIVAQSPVVDDAVYKALERHLPNVNLEVNNTYSILSRASAALVASGTATLETALMGVPEIVCYKTSRVSYAIGKRLIQLKFICIVNLIMDKEVVKELIQHELNVENLSRELYRILHDVESRRKIFDDYAQLRSMLSSEGAPSMNAAETVFALAQKK